MQDGVVCLNSDFKRGRKMKKAYLIVSIIINIILLPITGSGLMILTADYPLSLAVFLPLIPLSFLVISIVTLVKNKALGKSVMLKITILFLLLGLTFISFEDGIYAVAVFEIVALIFLIATIAAFYNKPNSRKPQTYEMQPPKPYCYKGKGAWDDAAGEYLKMTGMTSLDELTDEDNRQIYRYTMMPVAYYFYWLLKKGFLSSEIYDMVGDEIHEADIGSRSLDVLGILEDMDCCLHSDDMLEDAVKFTNHYADVRYATLYSRQLLFDYYEEIKNPGGFYYCVDFSWDVCERMYSKIDKAYEEWSALFTGSDERYYDDELISDVFSNRFGTELEIYPMGKKIKDNITDEYIKKCLNDLDSMNEYQFSRLDRCISDDYGDSLAGKVMEQFRPYSIYIFEPQEDGDVAYAVSGEADFEEEHGIAFYVRNGVIFSYGYGCDLDDIYSPENIRYYETAANDIEYESIENISQTEELLKAGKLVRTYLVPLEIGGADDESNMVYLTPLAIKEKELSDRRLQALIAAYNGNLKYIYKAVYYDDDKRFVPRDIYVRHDAKPSDSVFGFHVNVWY